MKHRQNTDSLTLYTNIIDALVSDGFIIVPDALDPQLKKNLLYYAQDQKNFRHARISSTSAQHVDPTKRSDSILWLDEDSSIQSEYLAFCTELQKRLNRELFLGLNYYESHFSIYEEGGFYEKHVDAFKNSKNRVVTTIYYLNQEWEKNNGGELVIYNDDNTILTSIIPQGNTLVIFLSDKFIHEVKPSKKKRYSIAGWFRVDK